MDDKMELVGQGERPEDFLVGPYLDAVATLDVIDDALRADLERADGRLAAARAELAGLRRERDGIRNRLLVDAATRAALCAVGRIACAGEAARRRNSARGLAGGAGGGGAGGGAGAAASPRVRSASASATAAARPAQARTGGGDAGAAAGGREAPGDFRSFAARRREELAAAAQAGR